MILQFENIDIERMGYRYRGPYTTSYSYNENDVVYKDGGAYAYKNGAFTPFILGQANATQVGAVVGYDTNVRGVRGEMLFMKTDGSFEFRDPYRRNVKRVKSLSRSHLYNDNVDYKSTRYKGIFLMEDGTVRTIGRQYYGDGGTGMPNDIGRTFPALQPYPQGIKIEKIYQFENSGFSIDQYGEVWAWGYNQVGVDDNVHYTGPVAEYLYRPLNISQILGIDEKVVEIYGGQTWSRQLSYAFKTETGKLWCGGVNQAGGLGLGANENDTSLNTSNLAPMRLQQFSVEHPIERAHLTGGEYGAGYFLTQEGDWYTAGNGNACWHRRDVAYPVYFNPWGSNKAVQMGHNEGDGSASGTDYERFVWVVLQNGDLFFKGTDSTNYNFGIQGTWDLPIFDGPFNTNVQKAWMLNGDHAVAIVLKNDGTMWHRGHNSSGTGPAGSSQSWNQYTHLPTISKANFYGQYVYMYGMALSTDGRIYCFGENDYGQKGFGTNTQGATTAEDQAPVLSDKIFVDYFMSGYPGATNNNFAVYGLTDEGEVWTWGGGNYASNQDDDNEYRTVPHKIIF